MFPILYLGIVTLPLLASAIPDKVVCYHESWSYWRAGNGKFVVTDIDTNLCTHVNYAFAKINSDGSIQLSDDDKDFLSQYEALKARNPSPNLLISIGGWSEGSTIFSKVAANSNLRKNLAESALNVLEQYGLDGVDFDWEYPGARGGGPDDKENFAKLLSELRTEFNKHGYILSAAVSSETSYYDVPGMTKSLDYINVMTYDFHGTWDNTTGINSPYPDSVASIKAWKDAGAPSNKLILGVGTYGHSFTLKDPNGNGIGAPVTGPGDPGPYTNARGTLSYYEICEKIQSEGWTQKWSDVESTPYAYKGDQWVGYDDAQSITMKGKFAVDDNLGGIMVWAVDMDDFRGTCGLRYPLLNAVKSGLKFAFKYALNFFYLVDLLN